MKAKRLAASLAISSMLLLPGSALAQDTDAEISNTGPDSTNTVEVNNNQSYEENNNQDVTVINDNDQDATSGDCSVEGNTTGGDCTTGDARNENTTRTTVSFGGGGQGGGNLPGDDDDDDGKGGGKSGGGGSTSDGTGGGSLADAGTGGGALPDTGASSLVDVSALRAALAGASSEDLAAINRNKGLSAGLLAAAALMSLLGAAGSAVYAAKKEQSL